MQAVCFESSVHCLLVHIPRWGGLLLGNSTAITIRNCTKPAYHVLGTILSTLSSIFLTTYEVDAADIYPFY